MASQSWKDAEWDWAKSLSDVQLSLIVRELAVPFMQAKYTDSQRAAILHQAADRLINVQ